MLSLFKRRYFLKDQLKGWVDIHNHILPGIDDGAAQIEDSMALIKRFSEMGVSKFIATPHIMNDYYPNTPETINGALTEVRNALSEAGMSEIKIKAAAEYMMDHAFIEIMNSGNLLTLHDNFVLVEMSYFQAPINLDEILFQLQTRNYKPLLAHPERYAFFHSRNLEKYDELKKRGCAFQLNILALTGHYGKNIQEVAFKLLDKNMYDFIGSDTHQMRHLDKLAEARVSEKQVEKLIPIFQRTKDIFSLAFS